MKPTELSRREILHKCVAAGLLVAAPRLSEASVIELFEQREARTCRPTPSNALGPYYKKNAPRTERLIVAGDAGMPLVVSGRVMDTHGEFLPEATVEVWHADHDGRYDLEGFRYRAQVPTARDAAYQFETVMPGHYPTRVAQHIHYKIAAPDHRALVTQLYFATDPVFQGDPDHNYVKDPLIGSRELIRPVTMLGEAATARAAVTFEICLERL